MSQKLVNTRKRETNITNDRLGGPAYHQHKKTGRRVIAILCFFAIVSSYQNHHRITSSISDTVTVESSLSSSHVPTEKPNQNTVLKTITTSIGASRKPTLYMHVGPPKTATSSIQTQLGSLSKELLADNIDYLGKFIDYDRPRLKRWNYDMKHPIYCFQTLKYQEISQEKSTTCEDKFRAVFAAALKEGKDLIMSDEVIGLMLIESNDPNKTETTWETLTEMTKGWDVRVIIGHRPLFEYLVSGHNQKWKFNWSKPALMRWPDNSGKVVPPIKWKADGSFPFNWPTSLDIKNYFLKYYDNVKVYDIYDGNIVENFVCHIIEGADQACDAYRKGGKENGDQNLSASMVYDIIGTAASQKNLFDKKIQRLTVAQRLKSFYEEENKLAVQDLPYICPSEEHILTLYDASLRFEQEVFPTKEDHATYLKNRFDKVLENKTLCYVNTTAVLQDEKVLNFLKQMKN